MDSSDEEEAPAPAPAPAKKVATPPPVPDDKPPGFVESKKEALTLYREKSVALRPPSCAPPAAQTRARGQAVAISLDLD